jgi:hypothetical protein
MRFRSMVLGVVELIVVKQPFVEMIAGSFLCR